jgi:hypothetical protein
MKKEEVKYIKPKYKIGDIVIIKEEFIECNILPYSRNPYQQVKIMKAEQFYCTEGGAITNEWCYYFTYIENQDVSDMEYLYDEVIFEKDIIDNLK